MVWKSFAGWVPQQTPKGHKDLRNLRLESHHQIKHDLEVALAHRKDLDSYFQTQLPTRYRSNASKLITSLHDRLTENSRRQSIFERNHAPLQADHDKERWLLASPSSKLKQHCQAQLDIYKRPANVVKPHCLSVSQSRNKEWNKLCILDQAMTIQLDLIDDNPAIEMDFARDSEKPMAAILNLIITELGSIRDLMPATVEQRNLFSQELDFVKAWGHSTLGFLNKPSTDIQHLRTQVMSSDSTRGTATKNVIDMVKCEREADRLFNQTSRTKVFADRVFLGLIGLAPIYIPGTMANLVRRLVACQCKGALQVFKEEEVEQVRVRLVEILGESDFKEILTRLPAYEAQEVETVEKPHVTALEALYENFLEANKEWQLASSHQRPG